MNRRNSHRYYDYRTMPQIKADWLDHLKRIGIMPEDQMFGPTKKIKSLPVNNRLDTHQVLTKIREVKKVFKNK